MKQHLLTGLRNQIRLNAVVTLMMVAFTYRCAVDNESTLRESTTTQRQKDATEANVVSPDGGEGPPGTIDAPYCLSVFQRILACVRAVQPNGVQDGGVQDEDARRSIDCPAEVYPWFFLLPNEGQPDYTEDREAFIETCEKPFLLETEATCRRTCEGSSLPDQSPDNGDAGMSREICVADCVNTMRQIKQLIIQDLL